MPAPNSSTRARAQDTSSTHTFGPTTLRERDIWLRVLNRFALPPAVRCVGVAIALHANMKTGRCNPGHARLSQETGIPTRSVERYIAVLRRVGLIAVVRGGRGHTSRYRLLWPAAQVADQVTPDDPPSCPAETDMSRHIGGRQRAKTPTEGEPYGSPPSGDGERERADALDSSTGAGSGAPGGAPGPQEEPRAVLSAAVIPLAEEPIIDAVLRELRGDIWRRGHVKDDKPQQRAIDRAAAAKALAIASAGDILAGGWKWRVAFEAGDGLRYLPELHVWLAMRGWEKPPPTKQAKRAMRSDAPRATSAGSSVAYALQSMARGQS